MSGPPPDRVYLQWEGPDTEFGITWCPDQVDETDVEYVRARFPSREAAQALVLKFALDVEAFTLGRQVDDEEHKRTWTKLVSAMYPKWGDDAF